MGTRGSLESRLISSDVAAVRPEPGWANLPAGRAASSRSYARAPSLHRFIPLLSQTGVNDGELCLRFG
jgi:hypothetical protein